MTNRELKKLSRAELSEMLIEQSELCEELKKSMASVTLNCHIRFRTDTIL